MTTKRQGSRRIGRSTRPPNAAIDTAQADDNEEQRGWLSIPICEGLTVDQAASVWDNLSDFNDLVNAQFAGDQDYPDSFIREYGETYITDPLVRQRFIEYVLVSDLFYDFNLEMERTGIVPHLEPYLARCPNGRTRRQFSRTVLD